MQAAFAQWQFSAGSGMRYVRMTETGTSGQQLVQEQGWLPGLELRTDYNTRHDWQIGLAGEIYRRDLTYDGRLQSGTAFVTDSGTTQSRLRIDFTHGWRNDISLIAAIEYDKWQRNVAGRASIAGLSERYTSWRLLGGGEKRLPAWPLADIRIKALLVAAQPERMHVFFENRLFDEVSFSTKPAFGLRLGLSVHPAAMPHVSIALDADWLRIRRSDDALLHKEGVVAGKVAQPEHQRAALGVRFLYVF